MERKANPGEHFNGLYPLAKQAMKLKPWEFIPPNLLFGVRLPGSVESAYIQIIGQAGEEFGILVIVGEESLHRLHGIRYGGDFAELRILALSYTDATDDLPDYLQKIESEATASTDGKQLIPTFTSHIPGRTPRLVSPSEADELQQYIVQALEVLQRKTTENFINLDEKLDHCLYRTNLLGQWVDSVESVPPDPRKREICKIPPTLLKSLWKLPAHSHGFQAEIFMMPVPYASKGDRGVFPCVLLIIDEKDGYAVHDLIPPEPTLRKMELSIPALLMEKFCELKLRPPKLTVPEGGKLHTLITQMGDGNFPFPVNAVEDPEPISGMIDSLWESIMRDSIANGMTPEGNDRVLLIKVSLMYDKKTYRKIAIGSEQTLDELHNAIFYAFDREEEHLYTFFFPGKPTTSKRVIMKSPAVSPPVEDQFFDMGNDGDSDEITIGELSLKQKQKFYYLFDWGDEWWHELTFEGEIEFDGERLPAIMAKKGDSPPQYPDWDEEDDE